MKSFTRLAVLALALSASAAALATDYFEEEPNDDFPPQFLTGDPAIVPGADRFLGSYTPDDLDSQYLRFAATGAPGIYRYGFSLASSDATADPFVDIYDTSANGFYLSSVDDTDDSFLPPTAFFDHLDTTGAPLVLGVDIGGFGDPSFEYTMSFTRTLVIPTAINVASGAFSGAFESNGANADWFAFTVPQGLFSFALTGDLDTEAVLYDSAGNAVIGSDDDDGLNAGFTDVALSGGTYYLSAGLYNIRYDWDELDGAPIGWNVPGVGSGSRLTGGPVGFNGRFTPVPEPASLAALGLGALALARRRRKSR